MRQRVMKNEVLRSSVAASQATIRPLWVAAWRSQCPSWVRASAASIAREARACAWYMKSPPVQMTEARAHYQLNALLDRL